MISQRTRLVNMKSPPYLIFGMLNFNEEHLKSRMPDFRKGKK